MMRAFGTMAVLIALGAAGPAAIAESVVMSIDRTTTLGFLRAATPYSLEVSAAGLKETFTLYNPRELRFEAGRLRLKVDCKGDPIPVSALLEPTLVVTFDRQRNAFVAKVQSLPVTLSGLGTIYLDQYLDPIVLPVSFSQTLQAGVPGLVIDTIVRDVKVLEDRIEARADLVFRRGQPASRASARR